MKSIIQILNIKVKNLRFVFVIASLVLILAACKSQDIDQFVPSGASEKGTQGTNKTETIQSSEGGVTITATDTGFEPASATVKSGQTITWVNNSSKTVQVASANHPTHTVNQEITGNEFVIDLAPGESKAVTVSKVGQWGYHDHLKPSVTGTVTVE